MVWFRNSVSIKSPEFLYIPLCTKKIGALEERLQSHGLQVLLMDLGFPSLGYRVLVCTPYIEYILYGVCTTT